MSGYSYTGGPSRCSAFWQEFTKCYSGAKHPSRCLAQRDDYMECIHGTKELARKSEIEAEFLRQQARAAHERKQEGEGSVPTRVGLVPPAEGDDK